MKALKYSGGGQRFITGIPARDLTASEVRELPANLVKFAVDSKVYVEVDEKEEKVTTKKEAENG